MFISYSFQNLIRSIHLGMRQAVRFLSNKYFLSLAAFILLMVFFDHNDVFTQLERRKSLKALETKKKFFQEEIDKTAKELKDLQQNPAALEKYAREKYILKKDNEDVFLVEDSVSATKAQ